MAEGEGSDAKSGPSDWRKAPQRPASWHEEDLARRGSVVSLNSPDYDDPEEVLREEEASHAFLHPQPLLTVRLKS